MVVETRGSRRRRRSSDDGTAVGGGEESDAVTTMRDAQRTIDMTSIDKSMDEHARMMDASPGPTQKAVDSYFPPRKSQRLGGLGASGGRPRDASAGKATRMLENDGRRRTTTAIWKKESVEDGGAGEGEAGLDVGSRKVGLVGRGHGASATAGASMCISA